jgi:hypothetical protein
MGMAESLILDERGREMLLRRIERQRLPFVCTIKEGKHRSLDQNRLQRLWCNEVSAQTGMSAEEVRGYIKLTIGVPLRREDEEDFRKTYDAILKPLTYEAKIALMMEPMDLPVTRDMSTKQMTEFLNRVLQHFAEKGIELTLPKDGDILQHDRRAA